MDIYLSCMQLIQIPDIRFPDLVSGEMVIWQLYTLISEPGFLKTSYLAGYQVSIVFRNRVPGYYQIFERRISGPKSVSGTTLVFSPPN